MKINILLTEYNQKMNSLMFTFSADQVSIQLGMAPKLQDTSSRGCRRRPSSSNPSNQEKSRKSSSDDNQLFENSQILDGAIEESPEKTLNILRIKNSSIQLQEKKKLRNIIDNMLGKNFDGSNNPKLDSISISNRKNLNKQRGYLNGNRKNQQKQRVFDDKECKQNQFNLQNTNKQSRLEGLEIQNKHKPNLKLKKFEFATIKINKLSHHSQRYPNASKEDSTELNYNEQNYRRCVNISRESIDKQSLGKKVLRAKTPKIMYPQSDSKLPSVFRTNNTRGSIADSLKKRNRISSAHFIADNQDKKTEQPVFIQKKKTLQNPPILQECNRTRFRPKSTMIESKRYSTSNNRNQQNVHSQFHPKRLVFDCNQELSEDIQKKLGSTYLQNRNLAIRISTRAKSIHCNYVHRKFKQISCGVTESNTPLNEHKSYVKNESHHSRQTAQQSTLQSSTDRTLPNLSDNLVKSIESKQFGLGMGLGYSITFQAQKQ